MNQAEKDRESLAAVINALVAALSDTDNSNEAHVVVTIRYVDGSLNEMRAGFLPFTHPRRQKK